MFTLIKITLKVVKKISSWLIGTLERLSGKNWGETRYWVTLFKKFIKKHPRFFKFFIKGKEIKP
jgi:hypothetical protein